MNKKETIVSIIREWDNDVIINAWNMRCEMCNCPDDEIFNNDDDTLSLLCEGRTPIWILSRAFYGAYNISDDYIRFNGYGNFESFDNWDDCNSPVDIEEIANYLIDNGDSEFEIDTDILLENFLLEYYEPEHREEMKDWIDKIMDEESFDLLTEDWDDLYKSLQNFSNTNY